VLETLENTAACGLGEELHDFKSPKRSAQGKDEGSNLPEKKKKPGAGAKGRKYCCNLAQNADTGKESAMRWGKYSWGKKKGLCIAVRKRKRACRRRSTRDCLPEDSSKRL